jgi:hypothetical protein
MDPLDTIKTKTRKITQTPYRLKIDDTVPKGMIATVTEVFIIFLFQNYNKI